MLILIVVTTYVVGAICATLLMAALIVKGVDSEDVFRRAAKDDNDEWNYVHIGGFSIVLGAIWPIVAAWIIFWHLLSMIGRWSVQRMKRSE